MPEPRPAYSVRSSLPEDVATVVRDIRPADLLDIAAVTDLPPAEAVAASFRAAHRRFSMCSDGQCVAVGGLQFTHPDRREGSLWLIGTTAFDRVLRRGAARHCRPILRLLARDTASVFNFVPETNQATLRWLHWMGFRIARRHENFRGLGHTCVEVRYEPDAALQRA